MLDVGQAGDPGGAGGEQAGHALDQLRLAVSDAGEEPRRPDQPAQGVIGLERGAGRADADGVAGGERGACGIERRGDGDGLAAVPGGGQCCRRFDEQRAIAAAIAEEVAVDGIMAAVDDTAQAAGARRQADVAADRAMRADRRRLGHVPGPGIVLRPALVVEDAGRADLGEVAGEGALQHAIGGATEIDAVVRAEHVEIPPAGIAAIEARAAIAGDAAVHLMGEQRPEILVAMGALGGIGAAQVMARSDRHVLQLAGAPLLADGAIMRMVDHQPFDDMGAERRRLGVGDLDALAVGDRRHAGHFDPAPGVVRPVMDLDRAEPAGADRAHGAVPAEMRHRHALIEAGGEQVPALRHLDGAAIDMDARRHCCFPMVQPCAR